MAQHFLILQLIMPKICYLLWSMGFQFLPVNFFQPWRQSHLASVVICH